MYDSLSTQARLKLLSDSAVTTDYHDASRDRSPRMYPAAGGVALASRSASGCHASESEAQEPRTLVALRKRGPGPWAHLSGYLGEVSRTSPAHPRAPVRRQVRSAQAVVGRQLQLAAGAARRFRVEPQRPAERPSGHKRFAWTTPDSFT